MSTRRVLLPIALVALALGLAPQSSSSPTRPSGSLRLDFTTTQTWRMNDEYCRPGTPADASCLRSVGEAEVAGLGHVTITFDKLLPADPSCFILHNNVTLIQVAGKGTLELSRPGRRCGSGPPPRVDGPFEFSVARRSGTYGGASGTSVYRSSVGPTAFPCHCGKARDTWSGILTVPGLDFDVTPPVPTGAVEDRPGAEGSEAGPRPLQRHGEGRSGRRGCGRLRAALGQLLQARSNEGHLFRAGLERQRAPGALLHHGQAIHLRREQK